MAYAPDKYQLTHLLQDAWFRLGQLRRWKVTGGSATTVVNTGWAGIEEPLYEDDDVSLIDGTVVVIKDAGGAGAAPEGEMSRITDYDSASSTITMDTLTAAIGAGDRVGVVTPAFPLEDMIEAANIAITRLGEIEIPDTSLTLAGGQTEYTLPSTIRQRPLRVNIQSRQDVGNYGWVPLQGWTAIPATAGSNWTLVVPSSPQGFGLQVIYRAPHPKLTAFDSYIFDDIHPELALSAVLAEALQWYNNSTGGTNPFFIQRENKAIQDLESAMVRYPISQPVEQWQGMPHWTRPGQYVPGTSDRMY